MVYVLLFENIGNKPPQRYDLIVFFTIFKESIDVNHILFVFTDVWYNVAERVVCISEDSHPFMKAIERAVLSILFTGRIDS